MNMSKMRAKLAVLAVAAAGVAWIVADSAKHSAACAEEQTPPEAERQRLATAWEPSNTAVARMGGTPVLYVDDDAPLGGDGLTWDTAYRYLQDALHTAEGSGGTVTEIRVAQGIYQPDQDEGGNVAPGDRAATFHLLSGVGLYGGYGGLSNPADPDERDIVAHETTLSGDLLGNDDPDEYYWGPSYDDNTYQVATGSGTDATAVMDGFTITAGRAEGSPATRRGGGMYNDAGSPTVSNCTFSRNAASWEGGGMYNGSGSPTVTHCMFRKNGAGGGGGMYNDGGSPTVTHCMFRENIADMGGGMGNGFSHPTVIDCTFIANSGCTGGGIDNFEAGPTVINCKFMSNYTNCWDTGGGGGMFNWNSNPVVANCLFVANNTVHWADGMLNAGGNQTVINCLFTGHFEAMVNGLYAPLTVTTVINCIFWDNQWGEIDDYSGGHTTVVYTDIQGGWPGGTNLDADPLFVDPEGPDGVLGTLDDDLRLLPDSPCLDAGLNAAVDWETDLDGNPRIADGDADGLAVVDMGVYERPLALFLLSTPLLVIPEGGSATFTVRLSVDPGDTLEVSVTPQSGDPDIIIQSGATLTFDSDNYSIPQTVTLLAADDEDYLDGRTPISVTADDYSPAHLTAVEDDDDEPLLPVLHVHADAAAGGSGASWAGALVYLQDALVVASEFPIIEGIWIAEGSYSPDQGVNQIDTDRIATFQLLSGVAIYGGFTGNETELEQRDWKANQTTLSGDLVGNDQVDEFPGGPSFADNSYHVVTGGGVEATAILDGFVISGGCADGPYPHNNGAGMYSTGGSPTLANCIFKRNSARLGGGLYGTGGNPTVIRCVFQENSSWHGAGLYIDDTSPTIANSTFVANTASGHGGGMCSWFFCEPMVTNCLFSGNSAGQWGGGMITLGGDPTVTNCTFSQNTANGLGGGLYGGRSTITNCIFWGNTIGQIHGSYAAATYSDVQGGWPGGTNIDADPLFVDPDGPDDIPGTEEDNLHLAAGSPCIDTGDPDFDGGGLTDFDYEPRVGDGDGDGEAIVDMGADEYHDCNDNGVLDYLDIAGGGSPDCNGNGTPDECEPQDDCQPNGVPDICDIAWETSQDCNNNGIPDECELYDDDCNGNGIPDECDIAWETSQDCNNSGIPDECELYDDDCNGNAIPDECDIAGETSQDCNNNWIPDECDIADGTSDDYDLNGVPDECDPDCNTNGIPDACDLDCGASNCVSNPLGCGSSEDCQSNVIPDDCDIADGTSEDCNSSAVPDECEPGGNKDCNTNGAMDLCDIYLGTSEDCNTNHVPDECDVYNCCQVGHGAGCSDPNIDACVCAIDPYCCELEWDDTCVWEVIILGCGTCSGEGGGRSQDCNGNAIPDECDTAGGTSLDCDGNGILDECEDEPVPCGGLDIRPSGCPNPLNRNSHGVLPVAVIGSPDFDVTLIDISSVLLWRADGVGGPVGPNEGPPGPHSIFGDVATPFDGEACDCHDLSGDGVVDLVMKFRTDVVVEGLLLDELNHGDEIELVVTGTLVGGAEFTTAGDCILIVPQGTSNANVTSNVAGLFVELSPPDLNVDDSGFASFQRVYTPGTVITLTAPPLAEGLLFHAWLVDGVIQNAGETAVEVTVVEDLTARAVYLSATRGPTLGPRLAPTSRHPTSR